MGDGQQSTHNSHQRPWWHLRPFSPPIVLAVIGAGLGLLLPVANGHDFVIEYLGPPVIGAISGAILGFLIDFFRSTAANDHEEKQR